MGLVIFIAIFIYIVVSIGVLLWAIKYASKNGKSVWRWGITAVLVMYMIPLWDWVPTVVVHKYYCEKEAGFWVYKTLDQWKEENPGALSLLTAYEKVHSMTDKFDDGHGKITTYSLNQRFNRIITRQDISAVLPIIRAEQVVKDIAKNEVLARYVGFSRGNSIKDTIGSFGLLKFWLHQRHCIGREKDFGKISQFSSASKHINEPGG